MKITGTSSHIKVEINDKVFKIEGEMIVEGFLAYSNTISNWDELNHNKVIDEDTRLDIIKAVINETKESEFKIEFE